MSRMRQVPALDIQTQEKYLGQFTNQAKTYPANTNSRPRRQNNPTPKFRLSEAPNMISSGCSSLREFCNSIQSITIDLNQLLNSVESILPLITAYIENVQNRHPLTIEEAPKKTAAVPQAPAAPNVPTPEDIQQLLDNPLVKNILTSFMQNNQK